MSSTEITPKNDSSLGLIFRLNALWAKVDIHAEAGDYASWNNTLDSLYRNLLYREKMDVDLDENKQIINIELNDKDKREYRFLCRKISEAKIEHLKTRGVTKKGIPKKMISRNKLYRALSLKDIWTRKLMQSLNLYMRETINKPGSVMFGR